MKVKQRSKKGSVSIFQNLPKAVDPEPFSFDVKQRSALEKDALAFIAHEKTRRRVVAEVENCISAYQWYEAQPSFDCEHKAIKNDLSAYADELERFAGDVLRHPYIRRALAREWGVDQLIEVAEQSSELFLRIAAALRSEAKSHTKPKGGQVDLGKRNLIDRLICVYLKIGEIPSSAERSRFMRLVHQLGELGVVELSRDLVRSRLKWKS